MNKHKNKGFTLIELIVVITILSILGTIAFISFKGFASDARDTVRLTDIDTINGAMGLTIVKDGYLPSPTNGLQIKLETDLIGTQGYAGGDVLSKFKVSGGGKDPLTKEYYPYFVNRDGNNAQVLAMLENGEASKEYKNRAPYFKGDGLGLVLDENNTPIDQDATVKSKGEFDFMSVDFAEKYIQTIYDKDNYYTRKAFMSGGQFLLNANKSSYAAPSYCPENFIPVPGNRELGQPGFCIGKYEASVANPADKTTPFLTLPGKQPVALIDIGGIVYQDCRGNGKGYHIMTLSERLTVARDIEQNGKNWSSGTVGTGYIKGGNNGSTVTGYSSSGIVNSKYTIKGIVETGDSGNTSHDELRKLTLSNGEVIRDFIGNVWEIVKPLNLNEIDYSGNSEIYDYMFNPTLTGYITNNKFPGTYTSYTNWSNVTNKDLRAFYGPSKNYSNTMGMGSIREHVSSNVFYLTGGDMNQNTSGVNENGLYSIFRYAKTPADNVGTRCTYMQK